MYMTINCKNYYNDESFNEVCEALEAGNEVKVYIDCIGHTRALNEGLYYKEELQQKYGDRLMWRKTSQFDFVYKLK